MISTPTNIQTYPLNDQRLKSLFLLDFNSLTVENLKWNDKNENKNWVFKIDYSNTHATNRNQPHKRSKYTSRIPLLASRVMMITSFNWLAMQHRIHTHLFPNQIHIFAGLIFSLLYRRHSHSTNWTVQNSNREIPLPHNHVFFFHHIRKACAFKLNWYCIILYHTNWNLGFNSFVFCHMHISIIFV